MHYHDAVGLDVGTHYVKGVRVKRYAGIARIADSEVARLPNLPRERERMLASLVTKKGWDGLPCAVSVSDKHVMLRSLAIGSEDPRSVNRVVEMELDQFEDLADHAPLTSYIVQNTLKGTRHALLAVGRRKTVETCIQQAFQSGLDVVDSVPESIACLNSVLRLPGRFRKCFANVQTGTSHATVLIVKNATVLFSKHLSDGPGDLSSEAGETAGGDKLDNYVESLAATIQEYSADNPDPEMQPESIIATGGIAMNSDFCDKLSSETGVQVQRLHDLMRGGRLKQVGSLSTACGLALVATGKAMLPMSLQPAPLRERIALRQSRPYWILSGIVLNFAIMLFAFLTHYRAEALEQLYSARQGGLNTLTSTLERLKETRDQVAALRRRNAPFAAAVHNAQIARVAMEALAEAKNDKDWIVTFADADSYFEEDPGNGAGRGFKTTNGFSTIVVEGYTPASDMSSLRSMIKNLQKHAGILSADLLPGEEIREDPARDNTWASFDARLFAIKIELSTP
jgi:hypothetical protein